MRKGLSGGIIVKTELCCFFQVCLGAEAEDKFHTVEVEGLTYDGKSTKVPLVVLKPSVMPSVSTPHNRASEASIRCTRHIINSHNLLLYLSTFSVQMTLGGFEITPPVTFRLQSGSGPVHISGQHFVSEY